MWLDLFSDVEAIVEYSKGILTKVELDLTTVNGSFFKASLRFIIRYIC